MPSVRLYLVFIQRVERRRVLGDQGDAFIQCNFAKIIGQEDNGAEPIVFFHFRNSRFG